MAIKHVGEAFFPSRYGKFRIHAFRDENGGEHLALVRCTHAPHGAVPVRVHSRCLTGDALTSLRCDCREQLEAAMTYLEKKKCGILVYLDQEGRGIGLANKIRAYALQDKGMDTVEANLSLGFGEDMRDFSIAADILKHFGVREVSLLTNNPAKIKALENAGVKVARRIPLAMKPNQYDRGYLDTKRKRLHHILK
jgi:GTP cyclohydrolase II